MKTLEIAKYSTMFLIGLTIVIAIIKYFKINTHILK